MKPSGALTSRQWRLAFRLALLAVLAHWLLGFAAAQHWARMLGASPAAWADICSPSGIQYGAADLPFAASSPGDEEGTRLAGGTYCAVCAATLSAPLPAPTAQAAVPAAAGPVRAGLPSVSALPSPALLRPPPRGPPVIS
ncbi:DUF2946 family protein [Pseudothauera rhizosphaerae]|uniref:DUF2946 family protein n=1 Tax=Pseudothauera rhizosphaerae TaxID=2565932 RepID=UPI001454D20E|nr:DUF2946 family protein [Pseudothauera rhizosphaerae]